MTGFAPAYLFKDVCPENKLGRQRWGLPPELRAGLSAVQSEKDKGFPQAKFSGLCTAHYKSLGFPRPGSSPVACPTAGGGVIWPRLAILWNWDLGNKHRTMTILQLLLLLRRVCVCVRAHVCVRARVCVRTQARMSTRALLLSHVQIFAAPWTVAYQAPLSVGFSRQEYWSGLPFPTPGNLPNKGIECSSLALPSLAGGFFATEPSGNLLCL